MANMFTQFELKVFSGYVSNDVETKYFVSGACKASFSLPLKKDKDADPVWLNCIAWKDLAEDITDNVAKGDFITVAGSFQETEYNGKTYTNLVVSKYWK